MDFAIALLLAWFFFPHPCVQGRYGSEAVYVDPQAVSHSVEFFDFITRPDIIAPKWDVKVYDKDAIAPGYWFVSPYEIIIQRQDMNRSWVGPHIYDGTGELVWSGSPFFNGFLLNDFRVSSVNGVDMLTGVLAHKNVVAMVNNRYETHKEIDVAENPLGANRHDFHSVEDGTKLLTMAHSLGKAPEDELLPFGLNDSCPLLVHGGFQEYDATTFEKTFEWSTQDHVRLDESFVDPKCVEDHGLDFVHVNSIDKFPDGDYLLSCRMTDTLYKISGKDGSIVWRFGGKYSDFDIEGNFTGQHSGRVLSQNSTHIILTMMDNARRPAKGGVKNITNDHSRGVIFALRSDTSPMTAQILRTYDHPQNDYAPGRGNLEILENGNAFSGWWNNSRLSENARDGRLIMEAQMRTGLRSYRSYKFPWQGFPQQPPDVYCMALANDGYGGSYDGMTTIVYVSWNGATEVVAWRVYQGTPNGEIKNLISSAPKSGFETMITYRGYAEFVIVEAMDNEGNSLGTSRAVTTVPPGSKSPHKANTGSAVIEDNTEDATISDGSGSMAAEDDAEDADINDDSGSAVILYIIAIATLVTVVVFFSTLWCRKTRTIHFSWMMGPRDRQRYETVAGVDTEEDELSDKEIDAMELGGFDLKESPR